MVDEDIDNPFKNKAEKRRGASAINQMFFNQAIELAILTKNQMTLITALGASSNNKDPKRKQIIRFFAWLIQFLNNSIRLKLRLSLITI